MGMALLKYQHSLNLKPSKQKSSWWTGNNWNADLMSHLANEAPELSGMNEDYIWSGPPVKKNASVKMASSLFYNNR